ncbi:CD226 antigen [Sphaeramia orbicularis]|uniref:CD226 antigen n=1 Tax=Sphaeramia orbicularis TaxID=375764 RepID=UPI0011800446|nr:CD226 antigen-like [Sphaeramia orbicularis]
MSLRSSTMAGTALGTGSSLLLLVSIIQGLRDGEVFHYKMMEAVVGQNISLPCLVKNTSNLRIVSTEWSKTGSETKKLALYTPGFGYNLFNNTAKLQIVNDDTNIFRGSYLQLHGVNKRDSGTYVCEMTIFPLGSYKRETEIKIKDADEIKCDMNSTIEVESGENVTIHCTAFQNAQYRWTKNKKLISDHQSLKLLWVTDANAGVYTLTVNTGNQSLHTEFIIIVRTETTSLKTGLVTSQFNVTGGPRTTTNVPITTGEQTISVTNHTQSSPTSFPITYTEPHHSQNVTYPAISTTHITNTTLISNQSATTDISASFIYGSTVYSTAQQMTDNETRSTVNTVHPEDSSLTTSKELSTLGNNTENPDATPTLRAGNTTDVNKDDPGGRSHLLLMLIIVAVLVLIIVAGILCRRKIIKQRMDLPPPFKPPPPPVKYRAARTTTQQFPTSRCNSVTEFSDFRHIY